MSQVWDDAGRLTSRTVDTLGSGVVGPTSESFSYDGLSRLVQASKGTVVTQRTYDSLSRLLAETTDARTVSYVRDDAGNAVEETLPSAFRVGRSFDSLDRLDGLGVVPGSVASTAAATASAAVAPLRTATAPSSLAGWETLATYAYQGQDRLAGKQVRGLTATTSRDAAGRLRETSAHALGGGLAFQENLSWSPRSLVAARGRGDLDGLGRAFVYDGAGQLTTAAALQAATTLVPNNVATATADLDSALSMQSQTYDSARNLLTRTYTAPGEQVEIDSPRDASGRNRPASISGLTLSYDANGNLIAKGDQSFEYDFQNRLVRVLDAGVETASYTYDAFGRRVEQVAAGVSTTTAWSGWQAVETYRDGQLAGRQIHGRGLDEIVEQHRDLDSDGSLESATMPWYDASGNLALVARPDGTILERYDYSAFGQKEIRSDLVRPEIHQVRVQDGEIWLEATEEVSLERLTDALATGGLKLENLSADPVEEIPLQVVDLAPAATGSVAAPLIAVAPLRVGSSSTSVASAPISAATVMNAVSASAQAYRDLRRRRVRLAVLTPPDAGDDLRLTVPAAALEDLFLNGATADTVEEFTWPATDIVVADTEAPEVFSVVLRGGALEVKFTEEPDLSTVAGALDLGIALTWDLSADRYTLRSQSTIPTGTYTLDVTTTLTDLAANPLATAFELPVTVLTGMTDFDFYRQPDDRVIAASAVGNEIGFHGLPEDDGTGLVYVRNRHYDPELGRFLQPDPLGYVDGPNVYQYGLNSPVNFSDPMGLCVGELPCPEEVQSAGGYIVGLAKGAWDLGVGLVTLPYKQTVGEAGRKLDELEQVRAGFEDSLRGGV